MTFHALFESISITTRCQQSTSLFSDARMRDKSDRSSSASRFSVLRIHALCKRPISLRLEKIIGLFQRRTRRLADKLRKQTALLMYLDKTEMLPSEVLRSNAEYFRWPDALQLKSPSLQPPLSHDHFRSFSATFPSRSHCTMQLGNGYLCYEQSLVQRKLLYSPLHRCAT